MVTYGLHLYKVLLHVTRIYGYLWTAFILSSRTCNTN